MGINHHKVVEFPVFSFSPWTGVREANGVTGIHWEQDGAGMEQGGGSISGITLEGRTEGRNVPYFLHDSVAGKAGSAPSIPMDVGPVVTQPGWFPVHPVPQDFGICGTALWAVQRHYSCFSHVLGCPHEFPILFLVSNGSVWPHH